MEISSPVIRRRRRGLAGLLPALLLLLALGARAEDIGQTLARQYGFYPDYATTLRVEAIGTRIALAAALPNTTLQVYKDNELNAMALPDGRVFVSSRMAAVVTDDELAFVLGHELTHVKEKHSKRQQERVIGGAVLGAILGSVLGGGDQAARTGADVVGGLAYGHYSQKDEYKADTGGIRLMARCGYDPAKAADAMQRLLDLYGRGDASTPVLGWFASHPDTKNRKQRLLATAATLQKTPEAAIPPPLGIAIALDHSAEHAAAWAPAYLAIQLAAHGQGRALPLTTPAFSIPALEAPATQQTDAKGNKIEPLPAVTYRPPTVPAGYRATLALYRVPAGRATTLEGSTGTAVEARLRWTIAATGFTGEVAATAQTLSAVPWQAQLQLAAPGKVAELADGKSPNVEGTLEAKAIQRVSMALAEIIEAKAPVDHSAPVTVTLATKDLRPGDYVYVIRGKLIVAEVGIDAITAKNSARGTVLWGTHSWKKKDKFVPAG